MLFMITFLASIAFGWYSKKYGFASMWISLFNLLFCLYLGVMITPTIVGFVPAFAEVYYRVICCFFIVLFSFVIVRYVTTVYFEHALDAVMPDVFSTIAAGTAGFFIMMIVLNYIIFSSYAVAGNVVSDPDKMKNSPVFDKSSSIVFSSCNLVHRLAGQPMYDMPANVVDWYKSPTVGENEELIDENEVES